MHVYNYDPLNRLARFKLCRSFFRISRFSSPFYGEPGPENELNFTIVSSSSFSSVVIPAKDRLESEQRLWRLKVSRFRSKRGKKFG